MKKLILLFVTVLIPMGSTSEGKLTKKERKFAVNYLESSMKSIFKTIDGLSQEQWNFQASAETWSVAGACEHLFIAENAIYRNITENIIKNDKFKVTVPESERITDQQVINTISDRSPGRRVKTPPPFEPKGIFATPQDFMKAYKKARQKNIDFTKKSEDDLKAYYFDSPAGKISAYQWIILLSAHAERHLGQMKEVMANSDYPD